MKLYELKANLKTVGDQLAQVESDIVAKAANPNVPIEDIKQLKNTKEDLKERFDLLKAQHDEQEAEQRAAIQAKQDPSIPGLQSENPKARKTAAKAELIRATIRNRPMTDEAKMALGDRNNSGGEKFLPSTLTNELLHEPFVKNPLRDVATFTNITNLEVPKIDFTLDDDDFVSDEATAKELKAEGDTVTFGRNKFKVKAKVSETVLNGTDTNLVQTVDAALESGLAAKEKKVAFAKTPKTGEEAMSFYKAGIKEVSAENKYKAIKKALADLHEDYRANAKICMTYQDYSDIIEILANGNATLYNAQPEQVLGRPVIFCDNATDPVVGDFRYSHFNYDLNMLYDRDKDVDSGMELFVLTAWLDHKIKLKSAFRVAKVVAQP
ncbi:phage major capsid protein [Bacillus wiedmannii]|uniref:Phage major capsid protein n=1 Tax=Bacillus wiedmannii TaxID=1890302 RepID=A0ABX5DMJ8_9BACI|nr:phage major capsid protein [Bacillus wiedmannii]PRT35497.1 phage major capsid protein [Bacillus wiedmannii]